MRRIPIIIAIVMVLAATSAWAKPEPLVLMSPEDTGSLGPVDKSAVAAVDTTYLLGGPGAWDGTFDAPGGGPDWHGWTGEDASLNPNNHWHVSDYMADALPGKEIGNLAMYCGDESIPACDEADTVGGYAGGWYEEIEWRHTVADTNQFTTVRLTGLLRHDTEPGYDVVYLGINRGEDFQILESWDDLGTEVLDYSVVLNPGDYTGTGGDEIRLAWRFESDAGWDDLDCKFPTQGACQIDDLSVEVNSVQITFDDFEPGSPVNWTPYQLPGVGDFSSLRSDLQSLDPCHPLEGSYQANFIDDGLVVPGTGGSPCIQWCYGPDGWIINNSGGLMGPDFHIINRVVSPALAWPAGKDGADFAYDVYAHEIFGTNRSGIFPFWWVRSTNSADPADIESAPWVSRGLGIDSPVGTYFRKVEPLSDLLVPDRQWVQVALGIYEFGFNHGVDGPNGTPAPYYDNVSLRAWDPQGPEIDLHRSITAARFCDSYPEQGFLDASDLASNSCRVDAWLKDNSGVRLDSLGIKTYPMRHGATTPVPAELHWVMKCNPVFDGVRSEVPDGDGLLRGSVFGVGRELAPTTTRPYTAWAFDLPDTGFFFPGDRLRWYVTASDELDGDIRTTAFPADTSSILDFSTTVGYSPVADITALPSVDAPEGGEFPIPPWLFVDYTQLYDDAGSWTDAFDELGMARGVDYDIIRPFSFDEMNMPEGILGYEGMILTTGSVSSNQLNNSWAAIPDEELIRGWLDEGDRRLIMAGDQLISGSGGTVLYDRLGVYLENKDITEVNGGTRDLEVAPVAGNGILPDNVTWNVPDPCPDSRYTEAIAAYPNGTILAHLNPVGSDLDQQAAVVATGYLEPGDRTAVIPFDLARISSMTVSKTGQLSAQASFLNHLVTWLNTGGVSAVGDEVPGVRELSVAAHPNPFNPATTISFALPRAGSVTLEIYDVQGRKVRTLINDQRFESGRHEQPWDGRDEGGRGTSSGVYFYRFAQGADERVGKLTLLK